ncbi:hypothetical protein EMPS_06908 [Entomortierella parvispora]|uniref:Bacterial low temperature requirement A protein-domain-containing protein n=1 Tax=Entomortierella parvispora TaxID=205924 RepID=A0A9P3HD55_9FUNG|nr:hypothetical protein EMPS_06908 [Entomortierella parvispora]
MASPPSSSPHRNSLANQGQPSSSSPSTHSPLSNSNAHSTTLPSRISIPQGNPSSTSPPQQQEVFSQSPSSLHSAFILEHDTNGAADTTTIHDPLQETESTTIVGERGGEGRSDPPQIANTGVRPPNPSFSKMLEPLRTGIQASQTFAEGMGTNLQSLRRKAFERSQSHRDRQATFSEGGSSSATAAATTTAAARPIMPRSRPSMTQFKMREQPSKMIIPPPYGQEKVQEAAMALAAGIPDGISGTPLTKVLSDSESATSDDEPEVRVHFEIHLQEDAHSEPICPLSERNLATLVDELELTAQERTDVEVIQTKEELASYFEKLPRNYDVQIIFTDNTPDSPGVTFAQDDQILNGESIAVVRRESISSHHEKKSRRRKKRYRRPTTDLSTMPVEEPKASWLELFYDLLFVANLTDFTHNHPITGGTALAHYVGWFVIMWWTWAGQTFWAARYDMDDLFTKVLKLVEFCALISFGAFSSDHLDKTSKGFIISYIVLKGVLVIEYGNVLFWARRNRSKKSLTPLWLQIGSNLLAMLIWGLSILVHNVDWRYVMWYSTIVIEVAVLISFGRRTSVTFAGSHLPERFALFTIIVLGENIIGLVGLSSGASAWVSGQYMYLLLFFFTTVILYALWWLYFDDFSEDIFHKTTTLSQLWAYLHLPLHICIVLFGMGALDLIRLYKEEHHITDVGDGPATSAHSLVYGVIPPSVPFNQKFAHGFDIPLERRSLSISASSGAGGALARPTDYNLTKQYFLVVCSLVFLCNSLLKWINLRSYDRFQKIVYLSRFLNAVFILCLLAVPSEKMTPFALLGSMAFFCVLQVAVDLAVIYFGAYGFVNDLEAWARSARSSIDLGSFLPSPLGGRSRGTSRATSLAGSVVDLNSTLDGPAVTRGGGPSGRHGNTSAVSLVSPSNSVHARAGPPQRKSTSYFPPQAMQQQQLSLQQQTPSLSQQQQQELYNMHVNANSLGSSGAYGNLVLALAEIKKRESTFGGSGGSGHGPTAGRQMSLNVAERGLPGSTSSMVPISRVRSNGSSNLTANVQRNSVSHKRPGTGSTAASTLVGGSSGGPGSIAGRGGAISSLPSLFTPPTPPS